MDKETLSQYGWIVICIIIISILLGLASPFGNYIKDAMWKAVESIGITASDSENEKNNEKVKISPYQYMIDEDYDTGEKYAIITANQASASLINMSQTLSEQGITFEEYMMQTFNSQLEEGQKEMTFDEIMALDMGGMTYKDCLETTFGTSIKDISSICNGNYEMETVTNLDIKSAYQDFPVTVIDQLYCQPELETINIPNSVTKISGCAFSNGTNIKSINIPSTITYIGYNAFEGCINLKSVELPNSVTSLGSGAFSDCSSLNEVNIPTGINKISSSLFKNCSSLEKLQIPETIKDIDEYAFLGCNSLKSVNVPTSIETINKGTFTDCTNISELYLPGTISNIKNYAFQNTNKLKRIYFNNYRTVWDSIVKDVEWKTGLPVDCKIICLDCTFDVTTGEIVTIVKSKDVVPDFPNDGAYSEWNTKPDGTGDTYLPNDVYHGSDDLILYPIKTNLVFTLSNDGTYYIVGDNTETYANGVVNHNTNIKEINVPSTYKRLPVKRIGKYAFAGVTALEKLTLPDSLQSTNGYTGSGDCALGNSFCLSCTNLTSINIPKNVTKIPMDAFASCINLKEIIIPNNITYIEPGAFCGTGLTQISLPDGITLIGYGAFAGCQNLMSVKLPNGLDCLSSDLFARCTSLKSISIPDSVTDIIYGTFNGCTNLTSVKLSANILNIGPAMFKDCTNLTSVVIPDSVTNINFEAFYNCKKLKTIIFPESVTYIASDVFYNTLWLKDMIASNPNRLIFVNNILIYNNTSDENITLANNVIEISGYGLSSNNIKTVTIMNPLTKYDTYAFARCNNLTDITFNGTIEQWHSAMSDLPWHFCAKAGGYPVHCIDGDIVFEE